MRPSDRFWSPAGTPGGPRGFLVAISKFTERSVIDSDSAERFRARADALSGHEPWEHL